ncbi:Major facilitator superfamily domain-containing protein 8 [Aphelenchoides besseyi]|nr:Major facilitator superfamily domain-containing protein 8 [Aphelenchoides besseyi]
MSSILTSVQFEILQTTRRDEDERNELAIDLDWWDTHLVPSSSIRSLLKPAMAISALDPTITENFYGFIIAAYSLGQIIFAPLVGLWSTKIRAVRLPILIVLLSVLTGNLVYFFAALLPTGRKYAVLLARFLVGVGGGNMSLLQSYAAMASSQKDRPRAIAIITGGISVGMCAGPALQLIFTPIGPKGLRIHGDLRLNMYTTPALACCFVNLMAMSLLQFFFVEKYATNVMATSSEDKPSPPEYDRIAVSLCHFTRFTQLFTWTNLETIGAPLAMAVFAFSREEAVRYFAISHLFLGFLSLSVYILFIVVKMQKYCDFRLICVFGLIGFVLFHFVTFSWPFGNGHIQTYSEKDYNLYLNQTDAEEPLGCPRDRFDWCTNFTPINVWVYFVSFVFTLGACWAQINVTLSTILSNILGPRKQQNQQSIFYAVGSSARVTGPIFISRLYSSYGPRAAWILEVCVLAFTLILWAIFWRRMVPLTIKNTLESKSKTIDDHFVSSESKSKTENSNSIDEKYPLGCGFFLIFFAYNSAVFVAEVVIDGLAESGKVDRHAGYRSYAILYGAFALSNPLAASIVKFFGSRLTMAVGFIFYATFQLNFVFLHESILYVTATLLGLAAGQVWSAQGTYLAWNSTEKTAGRHASLFWAITELCQVAGGIFLFFTFQNQDAAVLSERTVIFMFSVFTAVTVIGVVTLALLSKPSGSQAEELQSDFWNVFVSTLQLCTKPRMVFVIFCFLYVGLELAFNESIYPTSVAFTLRFGGNTKQLLAVNMVAEGIGQISGSYLSGLASNRLKRETIVLFGFIAHLFVYVGIFLNFPGNSSLFRTNETSRFFDHPQIWLSLLCGYLLGFGDAVWHTQLMAHLIAFHKDESAQSFSIFRFFEASATCVGFFIGSSFRLEYHLFILTVGLFISVFAFFVSERIIKK